MDYMALSAAEWQQEYDKVSAEYESWKAKGLKLNMARGKPSKQQLDLVSGILTALRPKATKKGAMMGFITLEDLTGQIECLLFPRIFERYNKLLELDMPVLLTGHLSVREEEDTKLLVDVVEPLDAALEPPLRRRMQAKLWQALYFRFDYGRAYLPQLEANLVWLDEALQKLTEYQQRRNVHRKK